MGIINRIVYSSLFKDSFWALFGNIIGKGLALITGIIVARFLGNEAYGEYGMLKNNLTMITIFSSLGLGYTATKFIAEADNNKSNDIHNIHKAVSLITFCFSVIVALIIFLFSEFISIWLEIPDLLGLLRITTIAVVFNALNATQTGELSGFGAYKKIAYNNIITGVFTFVLTVFFVYYWGISGAVWALVISLFINCVLNLLSLTKFIEFNRSSFVLNKKLVKKIVKFSLPVALQESTYAFTHWGSSLIMIKLAGYGEVGIYSVATQWMAVMLFVPAALRNVILSHLSKNNNDMNTNKVVFRRMIIINILTTSIPFIIIALSSRIICSLYGPTYIGLQSVLNICMFTTIVNSITSVYTQNMIALDQNWYLFISRLFRDILTLIFAYFVIMHYGNGALVMAVISFFCQLLYLLILMNKQKQLYNN